MSVYVKTNSFRATPYAPLINYKAVKEKALAHSHLLLKTWLPNGVIKAHEYIALNPTRHDQHLGSFELTCVQDNGQILQPLIAVGI